MIICVLRLSLNRGPLTGSINIQSGGQSSSSTAILNISLWAQSRWSICINVYNCRPNPGMKYKRGGNNTSQLSDECPNIAFFGEGATHRERSEWCGKWNQQSVCGVNSPGEVLYSLSPLATSSRHVRGAQFVPYWGAEGNLQPRADCPEVNRPLMTPRPCFCPRGRSTLWVLIPLLPSLTCWPPVAPKLNTRTVTVSADNWCVVTWGNNEPPILSEAL